MQLPEYLKSAISHLVSNTRTNELAHFSAQLSERYRGVNTFSESLMRSDADYFAYLTTRLPATYGAMMRVLQETQKQLPETIQIKSLLDVGAGPGTAFFVANEIFTIEKATLIEKEPGLIAIGKLLTDDRCVWIEKDLKQNFSVDGHDLVTLSYVLNEIPENSWQMLLESLWNATSNILVIVEPGTPAGFKRILWARDLLKSFGGQVLAPCMHQADCPMSEKLGWCHFSQRISRSSAHRHSKNAELSFEDEKFSYIVMSKTAYSLDKGGRILFPPKRHSGHLSLTLCSEAGIQQEVISRKKKSLYLKAKKSSWGDIINE